jgi:ABC-type multidrug transport system permease subunit
MTAGSRADQTSSQLILYFMAGLQPSAGQFFIFFLFTSAANLAMLALFRSLASSSPSEPAATAYVPLILTLPKSPTSLTFPSRSIGGILILVIAIYAGYAIPRPSMKPWFRWLSYAQPVSFAFEALLSNECKLALLLA